MMWAMSSGAGAGNAVLGWVSMRGSSTSMTGRSHPSSRSASPAVVIAAIGAAVLDHELDPGLRVRRVDRQVRRPGLEHRQDRDDRLGRPRKQQRHTLSRARPVPGQQMRQPVGSLIELAVGHRTLTAKLSATAPGVRATCSANDPESTPGVAGLGQHRPVADLIQPGVFAGIEQIDRQQPPCSGSAVIAASTRLNRSDQRFDAVPGRTRRCRIRREGSVRRPAWLAASAGSGCARGW